MNYRLQSSIPLSKLEDYFKLKNYSNQTIACYISIIKRVLIFSNKDIHHLTIDDFERFILDKSKSTSFSNQIINAGKLFLKYGLSKNDFIVNKFIRPRKELILPNVIPENHIIKSIDKIQNIKHKAILSLAYSVGLRRSDILNLRISDIDSKNMQIKINQGKGNKDAYLPLSQNCLAILRKYYKQYGPKDYLFEGQFGSQYSGESLNQIAKKYFGKQYHFHNIRHSTATHLLNKGVDIAFIQKLLRHSNIKTTMIYLKITTRDLNNLPIY